MNLPARSLGLALFLLVLFLVSTVALQWWLHRETNHLQAAVVAEGQARLVRALTLGGRPPDKWDASFINELDALLGGTVELVPPNQPSATRTLANDALAFTETIPAYPDWQVRVTLNSPALLRVQVLHQRILVVSVLLALLLALMPFLLALLSDRRSGPGEGHTQPPWAALRAQALGMEHFARISNDRTVALAEEHGARLRAEADLQVNRTLLDRSVDERIRLGRELHDNICQTLYAVCLTLESVQKKNLLAPDLRQRVDQCMIELRRLNQEVRSYLQDLEPANVRRSSFAEAVAEMIGSFSAPEGVHIEQRLDEDAVALIVPPQFADILNIVREAVSNSLRHGGARHISLLAARSEQQLLFAVQDNGVGFLPDSPRSGQGHGLTNMQARAAALGGSLHLESQPGKGTRVLLTLPVASPA